MICHRFVILQASSFGNKAAGCPNVQEMELVYIHFGGDAARVSKSSHKFVYSIAI